MVRVKTSVAWTGAVALLLVMALSSNVAAHADTKVLFSDGFENGNLAAWTTSKGLVTEQDIVASGSWAARAVTVQTAGFASKTLSIPQAEVWLSAAVDLQTSSGTVTLLRLRTTTGSGIASLKVDKLNRLLLNNETTATTTPSATVLTKGVWHTVAIHVVVNGSSSVLEASLDGTLLTDVSGTTSLGTTSVGRLLIGNTGLGTMDAVFDDVVATTPTQTRTDPVITAAGDICSTTSTSCAGTANLVLALDPDLALTLGDNQYTDGTLAQYLASYDLAWGKFKSRTMPAPGNHEWNTANAQGYRDYFGAGAQTGNGAWYSYNLGAWHLISLDSTCTKNGGCAMGSPEYTWLQQDLANDQSACTLAYWHHPRFSSGINGGTTTVQPFWDLLEADGADLVLNGHVHNYERFAAQTGSGIASPLGIREFVVGTGGAGLVDFGTPQPNSEVRIKSKGVLELTLSSGGYAWRFLNLTGSVLDSGTDTCH